MTAPKLAYVVCLPGVFQDENEAWIIFAPTPERAIAAAAPFVEDEDLMPMVTAERAPLLDAWVDRPSLPLFLKLQYLWIGCDVCGQWVRGNSDEYQPGYFDGGVYCSERCHARATGEEWAEQPDWIWRLDPT